MDGVRDGSRLLGAVEKFRPLAAHPSLSFVASGFHDTSSLIIMKCDVDIRDGLYANVALLHHVAVDRRAHDQGVDCVGNIYGVRGGGSTRATVFGEDWEDLPRLPSVTSINVDLEWKLRRILPTVRT